MKSSALVVGCFALITSSLTAMASERPDHFKGKEAKTLAEALVNFKEANQRFAQLQSAQLTPEAMAEIHQLTYNMEVALEKIHQETAQLKVVLEEVHLASEKMDTATVQQQGALYLKSATTLVK